MPKRPRYVPPPPREESPEERRERLTRDAELAGSAIWLQHGPKAIEDRVRLTVLEAVARRRYRKDVALMKATIRWLNRRTFDFSAHQQTDLEHTITAEHLSRMIVSLRVMVELLQVMRDKLHGEEICEVLYANLDAAVRGRRRERDEEQRRQARGRAVLDSRRGRS